MTWKRHKIFKWIGRILGGFVLMILLITITFYLGRGLILKRAVVYLNENQPGEVQLGKINLIPLMGFPNAIVQFKDVIWYENPVHPDSLHLEPLVYLHELYVSLDILELIRGDIKVEKFRLVDGFVRLEVYEDSAMNIEKALGISFGDKSGIESGESASDLSIDMDKIEMKNILVLFQDVTSGSRLNIQVKSLQSQFTYLPGSIDAGIQLSIDINSIQYKTINLEGKNDVTFNSHVRYDIENSSVDIDPSILSIAGLELETWGMYEFRGEPGINMAFRATNNGLEVLNFLFLGVLNMDEIEQIGGGSIHLDGNVTGNMGDQLPVVRVNGSAQGIGFRIKSLQREVNDISFSLYATNGGKPDLSEAQLDLSGFTASFPEGEIQGDIRAMNRLAPEVKLDATGEIELLGLDKIIEMDKLEGLEGHLIFDCSLEGILDRNAVEFLDKAGSVAVSMQEVGLVFGTDTLSELNGELYMEGDVLGSRGLELVYNGNRAKLEFKLEHMLGYLLDYERDMNLKIDLSSDLVRPERITHDSTLSGLLGDELKDLYFNAEASINSRELKTFLTDDSIPDFNLSIDSFGIELPVFADISDLNLSLSRVHDTLLLTHLNTNIGGSRFALSGRMINLEDLMYRDSGRVVNVEYKLSSPGVNGDNPLWYRSASLLPDSFRPERIQGIQLAGSVEFPVGSMVLDSLDLNLALGITELAGQFGQYSMPMEEINLTARKKAREILIDTLEGRVGNSNLKLSAVLGNFSDTVPGNIYGHLMLKSDLLDFDQIRTYQLPFSAGDTIQSDTSESGDPLLLHQIGFPDFDVQMDIGELRIEKNSLYGVKATLNSSRENIINIDQVQLYGKSGGSLGLKGNLNISDSVYYMANMDINLKDFNIKDLNYELKTGEKSYSLEENFAGVVTGSGNARVFFTPDWQLNMDSTTALFPVEVKEGELINFEPLAEAGKFLDNKDLGHVRFNTSLIRFSFKDSTITIPLTNVESTVGQILIEGEQRLDNSYLYLLRVPPWLVKDAAKSVLSNARDDGKEDEIRKMKMGNFVVLTLWNDGKNSGVERKDQREKYRR